MVIAGQPRVKGKARGLGRISCCHLSSPHCYGTGAWIMITRLTRGTTVVVKSDRNYMLANFESHRIDSERQTQFCCISCRNASSRDVVHSNGSEILFDSRNRMLSSCCIS